MATNVTLNGISYSIPALGDSGWAVSLTAYLVAMATGVLSKSGGAFTLTNEVDFGSSFGVKSLYLKSRGSNVSSTGIVRLANTESVSWRNNANSADIGLSVNASDLLTFNSNPIVTLALGTANTVLRMKSDGSGYEYAKVQNANVDDSAAIAYSKLNLSGSVVNADINASAAIAYSKLNLSGSIVNADISASAAIAYSKLTLTGSVVDADIGASAAIARTKLATLTANRVVVSNGSGVDSSSSVTTTELGYLGGVTSSIQTQIDSKEPTITTLATSKGGTGQNSTAVFPTSGTVVTRTATEALTNKDIDGGTASDTSRVTLPKASKATLDGLTRKQATLVYASDQNKAYIDDGSLLKEIGSSSSGGINYLINSNKAWNFDDGASTGWGVYADAAGVAPVDGTGGSPNVTFAASATAPLRGAYSGLFTKDAANRQGQGVSVDFTLDTQDIGKPFTFSFDTSASSAFTGLSGTESMRVYCYDVTNTTLLPGYVDVAPGSSTTKGYFLATSSTSYRFILHVSGTGTSAWTLKIDNVTIGQQPMSLASTNTDWIDYVPTFTGFGTPSAIVASYARFGNSIAIKVKFASGTSTGVEARISLPAGLTSGTTNALTMVGAYARNTNASTANQVYIENNASYLTFGRADGTLAGYTKRNADQLIGLAEEMGFTTSLFPISQWSSNIVSGDRAVEEFAYNTSTSTSANDLTSFANGASGALIQNITTALNRRVRFQTPIQPTDVLVIEVGNSGRWQEISSRVLVGGSFNLCDYMDQTGTTYGIGRLSPVNSTDCDVYFGTYATDAGGAYGAAGSAWSAQGGTSVFWRVRKVSGGAQVGYPIGQANIVYDPTTLDDINSTLIGSKEYFHGTTYNGGIAPTITLSGVSVTGTLAGTFIPYKMKSGNWRMRFNMRISPTNATAISGNTFNVIVNGVTYKNVSGQSDAVTHATSTNTNQGVSAYTNPNANTITYRFSTSSNYNSTDYYLSGDVQLESKPTWAY